MASTPDYQGKVRDTFRLDNDKLLIVATDRISVFDVVLGDLIPMKGRSLVALTEHWLRSVLNWLPNHMITTNMTGLDPTFFELYPDLQGRGMVVQEAEIFPVECIVRGYLEGSGLKEYRAEGTITGIQLPPGLERASRLPEVLFTPSTKAAAGEHDVNIDFETMVQILDDDREMAERLRHLSVAIYRQAHNYALAHGIILADTKFEFGMTSHGELILCDEVLTGDSSRFWSAASWAPGQTPESFDKQPVRDYCEGLGWNKQPPGPSLPLHVIKATTARYCEGVQWLTGQPLE